MSANVVSIQRQRGGDYTYTPLPGEEEFFINLLGNGDKAEYHRFCAEMMHGNGNSMGDFLAQKR